MTVDIQALTASISVAVSQAVKQALEQVSSTTVPSPREETREVETVVEMEAASIAEGTQARISSTPLSRPADKPFASIAVALECALKLRTKFGPTNMWILGPCFLSLQTMISIPYL